MALGDEVVLSSDPPEEEEEEDLVDPQDTMKESCGSSCEKYKAEWDACTERVSGRSETAETCTQELFDFVHCVDSCVSKDLFAKLK
ncbi:cytochrome b-c1 complex subunit 6, mitochondrial-like [Haliotis rufescens]|uniref:cytochrome b-c1 complex subunit 6, mitochondrial-like n=1 Tax=Haliotis rufescens TaxID=6454 RepID=UPI001EB01EDF|nr:cytochrome b-c1 complex subunit 6, mitochondrial-like [Haliotis rufescens]